MGMRVPSSFHEHFAALTDPRCPCAPNSRHLLMDILVIAVCAVISGAEGWEDIEAYGKAQAAWFADLLDLPHGIPGHDTFRRVLSQLDPAELTQCFIAWTHALSEASGGRYCVSRWQNPPPFIRSGDRHSCHPYGEGLGQCQPLGIGATESRGAVE